MKAKAREKGKARDTEAKAMFAARIFVLYYSLPVRRLVVQV